MQSRSLSIAFLSIVALSSALSAGCDSGETTTMSTGASDGTGGAGASGGTGGTGGGGTGGTGGTGASAAAPEVVVSFDASKASSSRGSI